MLYFISNNEHKEKPVLIHGFSIGAYLYGVTVKLILQDQDKYGKFLSKIVDFSQLIFCLAKVLFCTI